MPPREPARLDASLLRRIGEAMIADRYRLRSGLESLQQRTERGQPLNQWRAQLEASIARAEERRRRLPRVEYDDALPIAQRREEIAAAIRRHQVVVVCGETGSGKSTQLPKICLELGRGIVGMIGHTQPRRIAARTVAARIAEELRVPLGRQVGFKVRFTDATDPSTYVKLLTDGMLLAELQQDRRLEQYDTIILDEAHERSLNVDFLIGVLKQLLPKRPELKLIITSATIDAARFAQHFADGERPTPVIDVAGRTYPVEVRYRPLAADEATGETDWLDGVLAAVDELASEGPGDMLVFLPTERDIHEASRALRERQTKRTALRAAEVLPLYARLSIQQQQRVFRSSGKQRIVLATNVAESSLTVPAVRYVIDVGTARISRYSPRSKTQRLPIEPVSQASADQRKGRCGRIGPGICIRLYSEEDYASRDRFTLPEIQRTNLAAVILQMKALRLGDLERFPLLDPPRREAIRDGYKTLFELGALDARQQLTPLGRQLSRLPIDPRLGRMILAADEEGCLAEVLVIAAALEVQDPRLRPIEQAEAADRAHAALRHENSDFLTWLRLWDFYHQLREKLSRSQLAKACRQNFLSLQRMREWVDVHRQLRQLVEEAGLKPRARRDDPAAIHRAVLTGLLTRIAMRGEGFEYEAAGGGKAFLWPGSAAFQKKPRWIMAAEVVETSRRYLRTVGPIDPAWAEALGAHLVRRSIHDPYWDPAAASAFAYERVVLAGLTIVPRRRVPLAPRDAAAARQLLIQHGLVEAQWERPPELLRHNARVLEEIRTLEQKLRRTDLVPSSWKLYRFYDERLPDAVADGPSLAAWLRDAPPDETQRLRMNREEMLAAAHAEADAAAYPDADRFGAAQLPLAYHFEPGADDDGITVAAPLASLHQLSEQRLDWLVPGRLEEKLAALIKSLPKEIRRALVPAPDTARRAVGQLRFAQGNLLAEAARVLGQLSGQAISPSMFDLCKLPDELRMRVCVVDSEGQPLAAGRDLAELRRQLGADAAAKVAQVDDPRFRREGITAWDFGELPEQTEVVVEGVRLLAYPTLLDRGAAAALRLVETPQRAAVLLRGGVRRLVALAERKSLRTQVAWMPHREEMLLWAASIRGFDLAAQLGDLLVERAFLAEARLPRSAEQFAALCAAGRARLPAAVQEVARLAPAILSGYHAATMAVERTTAAPCRYAVEDAREQLAALVGPAFLTETPWVWLTHLPRYFKAIEQRFEKLRGGALARDRAATEEVRPWRQRWQAAVAARDAADPPDEALTAFRWLLEEYRVSLFAQKLGTAVPVSAKRLENHWKRIAGVPA